MNTEMLYDRLCQIMRVGFVNARMPEKMRVKVTLKDTTTSELVTDWLPVLCPRASQDMQYDLPDIGDQVLCLFLPYGLEQGFVIGAMYGKRTPPVQNGDKWHRTFADGTWLEYDRGEHKLSASVQGDVELFATGNMIGQIQKNLSVSVQGSMTATSQGPAHVASASNLSIDAPAMNMGGGGGDVTSSTMQGTFHLTAGDIIAEMVSLRNHVHVCPACGATTSPPVGSGDTVSGSGTGGGNATDKSEDDTQELKCTEIQLLAEDPNETPPLPDTPAINKKIYVDPSFALSEDEYLNFEKMKSQIAANGNEMDKLISCLSYIATEMAALETNEIDKIGWQLLTAFFYIWLSGKANTDAYNNQRAVFISWDFLTGYYRVRKEYGELIKDSYLFSQNAQNLLVKRLISDGKFTANREDFDYINPEDGNYKLWFNRYFQSSSIERQKLFFIMPDGLMASMGSFMLRALAKGYVEPYGDKHKIIIQEVGIVATDSFNFNSSGDDESSSDNSYRFWNCNPPGFGMTPFLAPYGAKELFNIHFNNFRKHGYGNDFIIFSGPHILDGMSGKCFIYA